MSLLLQTFCLLQLVQFWMTEVPFSSLWEQIWNEIKRNTSPETTSPGLTNQTKFQWKQIQKYKNWEILPPKRQGRQRELIWLAVLEGFKWTWSEQEIITVIFKGTWGLIIVFRRVGGLKVTFWGQYFFCRRSQRVVALVSQSDTNPNNKSDHETSRLVYPPLPGWISRSHLCEQLICWTIRAHFTNPKAPW